MLSCLVPPVVRDLWVRCLLHHSRVWTIISSVGHIDSVMDMRRSLPVYPKASLAASMHSMAC